MFKASVLDDTTIVTFETVRQANSDKLNHNNLYTRYFLLRPNVIMFMTWEVP